MANGRVGVPLASGAKINESDFAVSTYKDV
jgi:hypothetical protein